jgi:predicted MPP superfamily phosphohydrolase
VLDSLRQLSPDLIVFTGDIVNRRTDELHPFVETLSNISAPYGVYSILGNHDYGDYCDWPSDEAKRQNLDELISLENQMGWKMLNNETAFIHLAADSIALIGVENVGDPPFHTYGDLDKAYPTLDDGVTKILLSHNPAHWVDDICDAPDKNIALTLSGHTHAMQMAFGRISPAIFRYKTWGGLYNDNDNHSLYVNIGIGTVGFPARIGATPEITLFTLKSI